MASQTAFSSSRTPQTAVGEGDDHRSEKEKGANGGREDAEHERRRRLPALVTSLTGRNSNADGRYAAGDGDDRQGGESAPMTPTIRPVLGLRHLCHRQERSPPLRCLRG